MVVIIPIRVSNRFWATIWSTTLSSSDPTQCACFQTASAATLGCNFSASAFTSEWQNPWGMPSFQRRRLKAHHPCSIRQRLNIHVCKASMFVDAWLELFNQPFIIDIQKQRIKDIQKLDLFIPHKSNPKSCHFFSGNQVVPWTVDELKRH